MKANKYKIVLVQPASNVRFAKREKKEQSKVYSQKHLFSASAEAPKIAENGHFLAFSAENGYIFGTNFCIIFRTFAHKNELCVSMFTECEVPVLQYLHSASKVPAPLEQSRV